MNKLKHTHIKYCENNSWFLIKSTILINLKTIKHSVTSLRNKKSDVKYKSIYEDENMNKS